VVDPHNRNSFIYPVRNVRADLASVGGDEVKHALVATVLFAVFSNPAFFKQSAEWLMGTVDVFNNGIVTNNGLLVSAVSFFVAYWLFAKYAPEWV
jgi:hypothetical protein